jgi:hypothetical protein
LLLYPAPLPHSSHNGAQTPYLTPGFWIITLAPASLVCPGSLSPSPQHPDSFWNMSVTLLLASSLDLEWLTTSPLHPGYLGTQLSSFRKTVPKPPSTVSANPPTCLHLASPGVCLFSCFCASCLFSLLTCKLYYGGNLLMYLVPGTVLGIEQTPH